MKRHDPHEFVKRKLSNWGEWCQERDSGALGYPRMTAFARLGGRSARSEASIPVNSIEASETDQAVKSLQGRQSHLYLVLMLTYAKRLPRYQVAKHMARTERTIQSNLEESYYAIDRWFQDRQRAREATRQM